MCAATCLAYTRSTQLPVSQGMPGADTLDGLLELAASASRARGDVLLAKLVRAFAQTLKASASLITHAVDPQRVRTLAVFADGAPQPNYEYAFAGSPCAAVLHGELVHQESGVTRRIPATSREYQGYYGVPIFGTDGAVLGHLCAFGGGPLPVTFQQRLICEILTGRATGELQRLRAEQQRRANESRMELERAGLLARHRHLHEPGEIIGASAALARVLETINRVAPTDATVLISGETGTGKELVARAIHAASRRNDSAFIRFDCAARPSPLRGLELFGDGEGALDLASGGTLLLDEISALTPDAQARLLPAVQERLDVRIIATTNRDLRKSAQEGKFREDLFYRLNVFPIDLPPLRARADDIPALAHFFVAKFAPRIGRSVDGVDPDTLAALKNYSWPGNVRELENLVERALVLNTSPLLKIQPELLAQYTPDERADVASAATGMHRILDDIENTGLHHVQREHILRVLNATHWVIEGNHGAALKLGMKPATLRHRMKKLGIARAPNPTAQAAGTAPGSEIS
jgi:transcriptional regulator with GAF, ATPase, and Fis domain